jgi:hypothetical protein
MSVPKLVQQFYDRIWNAGDLEAVGDLLSDDFLIRGSLGSESKGREDFTDYVRSVRGSLSPKADFWGFGCHVCFETCVRLVTINGGNGS